MNLLWIFKDKHYINFIPVVIIPTEQVTFYFLFFLTEICLNTIFPGVFHVSQKQGVENEKHFNLRQSLFVFQKWPTEKKII